MFRLFPGLFSQWKARQQSAIWMNACLLIISLKYILICDKWLRYFQNTEADNVQSSVMILKISVSSA